MSKEGQAQFFHLSFPDYPGFKVYHYEPGSTTDKDVWNGPGKTGSIAQPAVADSNGFIGFFADGDYLLEVVTQGDVPITQLPDIRITRDNATLWEGNQGTTLPAVTTLNTWQMFLKHDGAGNLVDLYVNNGNEFESILPFGTNHVYNVDRYGAIGDGATDDTAAIQAAIDAAPQFATVSFGSGKIYLISDTIECNNAINLDGNGATLKAAGSWTGTDYMVNLDYRESPSEQRYLATKQTGNWVNLNLNGNDIARGWSFSRVYRTHFDNCDAFKIDGTGMAIDRFIESKVTNCNVSDGIDTRSEPMVDFSYNAAWATGGGDDTNMLLFDSCSFEVGNHAQYINLTPDTAKSALGLRHVGFINCLFHNVAPANVNDEPTRHTAVPDTIELCHLESVQHIYFIECVWQITTATNATIMTFGATDTTRSNKAQNIRIYGGAMKAHTGGTGNAFVFTNTGGNIEIQGVVINSALDFNDASQVAESNVTHARYEVDHGRHDSAKIGLRLQNTAQDSGVIGSDRSPQIQFKNPGQTAGDNSCNEFIQQSGDKLQRLFSLTNKAASTEDRSVVLELDTDGEPALYANADDIMKLGIDGFSIHSVTNKVWTAAPTTVWEGMEILVDGATYDPASVGAFYHKVVYNGTAWVAV